MAELGEIRKAREIWFDRQWKNPTTANTKYIYHACEDCGKERWVKLARGLPTDRLCIKCAQKLARNIYPHPMQGKHHSIETRLKLSKAHKGKARPLTEEQKQQYVGRMSGENNPRWKGGRTKGGAGYIYIQIKPDDFFYPMANKAGYVLEHRLVVAKRFNRCLLPWEVVHHKDGTKDHNEDENLVLLKCSKEHLASQAIQNQLRRQEKEIENLKIRITLLEAENTLLKAQEVEQWQVS